jgi:hypothetical protein
MIGNRYLQSLFEYPDEDTGLNQLLELLKSKEKSFLDSLYEPVDLDECDDREIRFLILVSALIDYYLQLHCIGVPDWIRDKRLAFGKPYYHSKRISDFEKVRLLYTNPAPMKARNVYFDPEAIQRV